MPNCVMSSGGTLSFILESEFIYVQKKRGISTEVLIKLSNHYNVCRTIFYMVRNALKRRENLLKYYSTNQIIMK